MFVTKEDDTFPEDNSQSNSGDQLKSDLPDWINYHDNNQVTLNSLNHLNFEDTSKLNIKKKNGDLSGWKQEATIESDFPTQPIKTQNIDKSQTQDSNIAINTSLQDINPEATDKPIYPNDDEIFNEVNQSSHSVAPLNHNQQLNQVILEELELTNDDNQSKGNIPFWLLQFAKSVQSQDSSDLPLNIEIDNENEFKSTGMSDTSAESDN